MSELVIGQNAKMIIGAIVILIAIAGIGFFFSSSLNPLFKGLFNLNIFIPKNGYEVNVISVTDFNEKVEVTDWMLESYFNEWYPKRNALLGVSFSPLSNVWIFSNNDDKKTELKSILNKYDSFSGLSKDKAAIDYLSFEDYVKEQLFKEGNENSREKYTFSWTRTNLHFSDLSPEGKTFYLNKGIKKKFYSVPGSEFDRMYDLLKSPSPSYEESVKGDSYNDHVFCYLWMQGKWEEKGCKFFVKSHQIVLNSFESSNPLIVTWENSEGEKICQEDLESDSELPIPRASCTLKIYNKMNIQVKSVFSGILTGEPVVTQ